MSLEQAIAEARERLQVKESLEELRKAIRAQFGEDIGHWLEPAYVISSEDTPEARFTHNGVCLSLWRDDEGWGVSTDQTNERLSGDWEDTDEACDELLVLIDDLATAQSA